MGSPKLSEQAIRIATRMLAGELFYSRLNPRLPPAVREELQASGLRVQSESPRHESTFYYPADKDEFRERLDAIVRSLNAG